MFKMIYANLLDIIRKGHDAVIETVFSGNCGNMIDIKKQLYSGTECDEVIRQALKKGLPLTYLQDNSNVFVEPFYPEERLIVLGGGHIAIPLSSFAAKTGFAVTVVDDRPSFADKRRFPTAKNVICLDFIKAMEQLGVTERDFVVIITRGHRYDQVCLEQLLKSTEPFYTGMIGSKRRIRAVKDELIAQDYDADRLQRLHAPVGLSIGAVTPEEIAVSIVAELIYCKRIKSDQQPPNGKNLNGSDIDIDVIEILSTEIEKSKAIVTVISTKGSVPRGVGAKMLVYPDGKIAGSIGGGCSEAAVICEARQIISSGRYCLKTLDMTGDVAESEGMVCGGVMQVLIEDYK